MRIHFYTFIYCKRARRSTPPAVARFWCDPRFVAVRRWRYMLLFLFARARACVCGFCLCWQCEGRFSRAGSTELQPYALPEVLLVVAGFFFLNDLKGKSVAQQHIAVSQGHARQSTTISDPNNGLHLVLNFYAFLRSPNRRFCRCPEGPKAQAWSPMQQSDDGSSRRLKNNQSNCRIRASRPSLWVPSVILLEMCGVLVPIVGYDAQYLLLWNSVNLFSESTDRLFWNQL